MLYAFLVALQNANSSWDPDQVAAAAGTAATVWGAAWGISRIGIIVSQMAARQPEVAGGLQTTGIVLAALVEGVSLFALVIFLLFRIM